MARCVGRGKETAGRPVCVECTKDALDEADRERIPVVGNKPEARRIGFDPLRGRER